MSRSTWMILSTALLISLSEVSLSQVTPTNVLPSPGSQVNSAAACLELNGTVTAPGSLPSALLPLTGFGTLSTTFAYQSMGSIPTTSNGSITLSGSLQGTSLAPFILALSIEPGGTFCGGFAGAPCMNVPRLYSSVPTSAGIYHLNATPFIILDGFGTLAPPGALGPGGAFPLNGTLSVESAINAGTERSFALQALVADPSAPTGSTLTAALTVEQWVFFL